MASAAEQLAANLSLGTFSKATELKQRIWFTLSALIVYRLGTYIPIPGVDASVMTEMMQRPGGGIFGMLDMFSGGAVRRVTVFALGIMPYISASIIIQLMTAPERERSQGFAPGRQRAPRIPSRVLEGSISPLRWVP